MRIDYGVFKDGSKDLWLETADRLRLTSVGILLPGTHNLGVATQKTVVKVVFGRIDVNDHELNQGEHRAAVITEGEEIVIRNVDYAIYQVLYGNFGRSGI